MVTCSALTKKEKTKCKIHPQVGKEKCWRHDENYLPKNKKTTSKKELHDTITELTAEVNRLNAMIEGMKLIGIANH
jgi:hypothetical protein